MVAVGFGLLGGLAGTAGLVAAWRGPGNTWPRTRVSAPFVQLSNLGDISKDSADTASKGSYKTAYITSAAHPYKCFHILGKPTNGTTLQLWDCPVDQDLVTKFLIPIGAVGPIRPAAAPELCLDSPEGYKLQLWACEDVERRRSSERVHFLVRPEASAWLRYNHYDLPDEQDAEQMSASDLGDVMQHVEGLGFAGFSVWKGQAWIKGVQAISKNDLHYMGLKDPVEFYVYRPRGDFTIRSAHDPGLCVGTPGNVPKNGDTIQLLQCGTKGMYSLLEETRLELHYAILNELEEERMSRIVMKSTTDRKQQHGAGDDAGRSPGTTETPKSPEVMVSMTLTNIDYGLFKKNRALMAMVSDVIKEEVSSAAGNGISPGSVEPLFREGSVKVSSVIHVPEDVPLDSVVSKVKGSRTLKSAVAERVTNLPGMAEVTTGVVAAEHDDTKASGAQGVPSGMWSWIALFLAAVLAGICCVAACAERARFRSLLNRMRSKGDGKSSALSVYKTREPTINIDAPGVWRLGRITDRMRPDQASYDVDLDSCGGGRPATLAVGYGPVNGESPAGTLPG